MSAFYKYTLSTDVDSEVLTSNPAGWDNLGIVWARNTFYHSVLRSYILSLRFKRKTGGGGEYIISKYDSSGLDAIVNITIGQRNPQTDDYDTIYTGVLNFNPDRFTIERDFVEIGIIDSDKLNKLKSREEIDYNVLSEVSTDNVSIDSFVSSPKAITFKKINISLLCESTGNMDIAGIFIAPAETLDPYYTGDIDTNEIGSRIKISDSPSNEKIYENDTGVNVNFRGNIIGSYSLILQFTPTISGNNNAIIQLFSSFIIRNSLGVAQSQVVLFTTVEVEYNNLTSEVVINKTGNFNIDFDETLSDGDYVDYNTTVLVSSISNMTVVATLTYPITNLTINEISQGETDSPVQSIFYYEAFTRLIQLVTSETDTSKLLYSELLGRTDSEFQTYVSDGDASLDAITSGKAIRQYPDTPINLNIRDLFKTLDSCYNVGLGYDRVNERFFIEKKEEFYKNELMFDLGEVSEFKIKPLSSEYFSKLIGGWGNDVKYEDFQGANEFNLPTEHSIQIPIKDPKDLKTTYSGDSIGIEITRRAQYSDSPSEDTDQDDLIYIVRTDGTETIQAGSTVSGFGSVEDYYNIALTPRENLIRWGNVLKIPLWKSIDLVKFVKSQKNIDITYTNQNGDIVTELSDIQSSELTEERLFNPEQHTFEQFLTTDQVNELNTDPHRYISYEFEGEEFEGFIDKIETGGYNKKAQFTTIAKVIAGVGDNYEFEDSINYEFEDLVNYEFDNGVLTLASITTTSVTDIEATTAISGGIVTNEGASPVTAKGVVWSTLENPTLSDDSTNDGSGLGAFVSSLTGLIASTTYFVRAYATNSGGTSYGSQETFDSAALYCAEFQAVYDHWIIKPSDAVAFQMNIMVDDLVNSGEWATFDLYYNIAIHTNVNGEHLTNWKNPGTFDAVEVNGPIAFTAFEGLTGDGLTQYIRTNYVPSVNKINYNQDSAALISYMRLQVVGVYAIIGASILNAFQLVTTGSGLFYGDVNNQNGKVNTTNTNTKGFIAASRTASNLVETYNDDIKYSEPQVSQGDNVSEVYILRRNSATSALHNKNQASIISVGGGLIEAQMDTVKAVIIAYMTSNGKNV